MKWSESEKGKICDFIADVENRKPMNKPILVVFASIFPFLKIKHKSQDNVELLSWYVFYFQIKYWAFTLYNSNDILDLSIGY